MAKVQIIKRGNNYYARRVNEEVGQAVTVENPALKWNVLDATAIAGRASHNFFVLPVDPDEIYGNYSRPYLEVPARITGLKFDILPPQLSDWLHAEINRRIYTDNINRVMRGTLTLFVNRYPIFDWKVDDVGAMLDSIEIGPDANAVISLQTREFTVFRDLIASRMVRTRGQDQIYVNLQLKEALSGGGDLPADFALKTTLQIRPEQRFIAGTEVIAPPTFGVPRIMPQPRATPLPQPRAIPRPPTGQARPPVRPALPGAVAQLVSGDWTPYAFYSILNKDKILANGGRVVEFFVDIPDPLHLDGNYDEPYIHRDMSIQGLKVSWYPWIAIGANAVNSTYGYLINAFKDATFELIVNRAPIYTFKGSDLFGATIIKPYSTESELPVYHFLYAKLREKYLVFRDLIDQRKLTVSYLDDVKIRARLPVTLTSMDFEGCRDFEIKLTLLTNAKPKPIKV